MWPFTKKKRSTFLEAIPILKTSEQIFIKGTSQYFVPETSEVVLAWTQEGTTGSIDDLCEFKTQYVIYLTTKGTYVECSRPMVDEFKREYNRVHVITQEDVIDRCIFLRQCQGPLLKILVDNVKVDYQEV